VNKPRNNGAANRIAFLRCIVTDMRAPLLTASYRLSFCGALGFAASDLVDRPGAEGENGIGAAFFSYDSYINPANA